MTDLREAVIHCLDILPQLSPGSADFIRTDPPYVNRYQSRGAASFPTTVSTG